MGTLILSVDFVSGNNVYHELLTFNPSISVFVPSSECFAGIYLNEVWMKMFLNTVIDVGDNLFLNHQYIQHNIEQNISSFHLAKYPLVFMMLSMKVHCSVCTVVPLMMILGLLTS